MKKVFLFSLFFITAAAAGAQQISIVEKKAADKVPFAQPFALQFVLSHTPGYEVSVNQDSLSKDFEITQLSSVQNSPGTQTYDFTAMPFVLGKSTFTVTFDLTQNGKTFAQAQESVFVDIAPVKTFEDPNLREIRPPHIPSGWLMWLLILLGLGAVAGVWYYWYKRLHERARQVAQVQDSRPGNVIALSKIDALLDSGLWEQEQYKLFYITLSDILREYLWRQLGVDASADTSAELLRRVKNMPQLKPLLYALRDFLSSGDLVKFAKAVPTLQVRDKDITLLRQIIEKTSPQETPAQPGKEAK